MKARTSQPSFPKKITVQGIPGISATIYRQDRTKLDKEGKPQPYTSYLLSYSLNGKRRMEAFAELTEAETAGKAAVIKIANGQQLALELTNGERMAYLRAKEILTGLAVDIDEACRVYAEGMAALGGLGTILEACQEYAKRHASLSAKVTVLDAATAMVEQAQSEADKEQGKRKRAWAKLLRTHLLGKDKFATAFNCTVDTLEAKQLNAYLDSLTCAERTKKNVRDVLKHFLKWCRGRGYIPKDADPMADVQDYRKRKRGKIHVLAPEELARLLEHAEAEMVPYIALRAFAGLRDVEARAIEWPHIDLDGGWITITEEVAKLNDDSDGTRRLIPVRDCLKAWLRPYAKPAGKAYPNTYSSKQIAELCTAAKVDWKRNCLRHSYISYAVADSNDIPAVAIHSGNSPAIIRKHYLKVVKPEQAKAWFNVLPAVAVPEGKITKLGS